MTRNNWTTQAIWFVFQIAVAVGTYAVLVEITDPNQDYGYALGFMSFGAAIGATCLVCWIRDRAALILRTANRLGFKRDKFANGSGGVTSSGLKIGDSHKFIDTIGPRE